MVKTTITALIHARKTPVQTTETTLSSSKKNCLEKTGDFLFIENLEKYFLKFFVNVNNFKIIAEKYIKK